MFCFSCSYAYVAVIPSEDNIRKTSALVLLMLHAYFYAYVAAVLKRYPYAYALVKTSLQWMRS